MNSPDLRKASSVPLPVAIPGAAIELFVLFTILGLGVLGFDVGWLTPNGAAVLTALFLVSLVILSWKRFDQGRHPCFLFLCVLTLVQSGRFLAYLFGDGSYPLRIGQVAPRPFDLTRAEAGTVLLCLSLSALCVYAICRWNYRRISPPSDVHVAQYIPYLSLVFYSTLPAQLYKNYCYYQSIQENGGYLYFWIHHGDIASSVPFLVRAVALLTAPAFLAIFVFDRRKKWVWLATVCYFATTVLTLLVGFRSGAFALVLVLWYVAKIKSTNKVRLSALAALVLVLVVIGGVVQTIREDSDAGISDYTFAPLEFVRLEGDSLDVTSAAVKYKKILAPYALSYVWYDLQDAFVLRAVDDYVKGQRLPNDVTVLLNPVAFSRGLGVAGSYIAEMYLLGGVAGVAVLSLLLGGGLHLLHRLSRNMLSLFVVASILPVIVLMPRGQLLDWGSDLVKTGILVTVLWIGWLLYRTLMWLRGVSALTAPAQSQS